MIPIHKALLAPTLRRPVLKPAKISRLVFPRFYSASLPLAEYHRVADETMDKLTSELETLLEENDISGSDVEYSVTFTYRICLTAERSDDIEAGKAWDVCGQ
jgi:Frataxin-like domain